MANTFFGLNIGVTGIQAANASINVTANNIANEYTDGYSRQVANQQATTPIRVYQKYGTIGTGVEVTSIERIRNEYYDIKYQQNETRLGENSTLYYYMLKVEDLFNESKVDGFTEEFDNLYASLEELKKDPSDLTTRNLFLNNAESFLEFIQEIKGDLKLEQEDLNAEISNNVSKINSLAEEIAAINKQINVVEMSGGTANELRDKRAVLLEDLAGIVDISTTEETYSNGKTEFTVRIGTNTLVSNYDYYTLDVISREVNANDEDVTGLYNIQWSYGAEFNPVKEGVGGTLKALIEIRDGNNGVSTGNKYSYNLNYKGIPYYISEINNFLDSFTTVINEIHAKGTNSYGESTQDIPIFVQSESGKYVVNEELMKDSNKMATAYNYTDGASQSDLVDELIATKKAVLYEGGTANEFLQSLITEIAVDTRKAKTATENYTNMQVTIDNQRLSIMGVDKDEEAMNLVKFQEAFELNSHVISVMAQIYDKLINETGV